MIIPINIYHAIIGGCALMMGVVIGAAIVAFIIHKCEPAPKEEQIL